MTHWDELLSAADIKECATQYQQAIMAAELKPAALAVWAAWWGPSLISHMQATDLQWEWMPQEERDALATRKP